MVRLPALELLATPTSLPGPKSKELGRRIERPSASRHRPEDRSPKASAGRSRGSREDATSASGKAPVNRHTRRQLKETTPLAKATRRERTSAAEDLHLGTEVPRQRPATLEARSHTAHASALRVNHQTDPVTTDVPSPCSWIRCRHRNRVRWFQHTSGCHPCHHGRRRNPLGSTPSGVPPGR